VDLSLIDAGLPLDLHDVDLAAIVDAEADRSAMLAPQLTVSGQVVMQGSLRESLSAA